LGGGTPISDRTAARWLQFWYGDQGLTDNYMKEKRINGQALENIMRDVLDGMQEFTAGASADSVPGEMTILSVERPACQQTVEASVIPFPSRHKRGS
jgi:hypothetical protein